MVYNAFWPIMEFGAFWWLRFLYRFKDRGFTSCNSEKTKKTTIQQYVELYSGPVYFIHYKYSTILNTTFVTFMYGLGLPILFPVAVVGFFVLLVVEKAMLYYSYRAPPMYDDRLNKSVLHHMTYAPLLFLGFGYWMFSNKQLFSNDVGYTLTSQSPMPTGHYWYEVFTPEAYKIGP